MTPFRASYFDVDLTWEPGEGITDTLGNVVRSAVSFIICSFYFLCFASLFWRAGEGDASSVWLTNICNPTSFQVFLRNNKNLLEVYMSNRLRKKKDLQGLYSYSCFSTERGWCGRAANLSFLSLKVKTFWDPLVWFHPGGDKSGWSHPGLGKKSVLVYFLSFLLLTVCF